MHQPLHFLESIPLGSMPDVLSTDWRLIHLPILSNVLGYYYIVCKQCLYGVRIPHITSYNKHLPGHSCNKK